MAYRKDDPILASQRLQLLPTGTGGNGAPDSGMRMTVRLIDDHSNGFFDTVASGTSASIQFAKSSYLANPSVATPTGSLNQAWTIV